MITFKVDKILNNSLVLSKNSDNNEVILMGKGIGFNAKVGDLLDAEQIEKCFVLQQITGIQGYLNLIESLPDDYIELTKFLLDYASKTLQTTFRETLFFTLLDHLNYAIERYYSGVVIQNRLLYEVKSFYPKEFEVAKYGITYINQRLNISLPEEEAGNIAFHLVNGQSHQQTMQHTLLSVKMLKDIFNIIQFNFAIRIDKQSLHYSRFLTHMQFFIQRIFEQKQLQSDNDFVFQQVIRQYPDEFKCANVIKKYLINQLNITISNEEILYLILHIIRIVH